MIATDVAARGIHVDGVAGVVHFDPPADHKDYVHRSGRTARAGSDGVVVSLVIPELRKDVGQLQRKLGYPKGLDSVDLSVLGDAVPMIIAPAPEPVRSRPANQNRRSRPSGSGGAPSSDRNGNRNGSRSGSRNGSASRPSGNGAAPAAARKRPKRTRNTKGYTVTASKQQAS